MKQSVKCTRPKRPGPLKAVAIILYNLHQAKPLEHEVPPTALEDLTARLKFAFHVSQRTARIAGTVLLRALVKHPLGWTIPQEVVCMLMYGILQSRQVPSWRGFFSGVGDLQSWVPLVKEKVSTGSCDSWWIRLVPERRPKEPRRTINWLYLHGGAFVAGDALMYSGVYAYWMVHLAKQGIDCSILSVDYPLAPEHPFPAGLKAAADSIDWLLHESGQPHDYFAGGDSAGGNLTLGALTLLRDAGKLSRQPLGITLLSPAVDLSNTSVYGNREPVSSHFEQQGSTAAGSNDCPQSCSSNGNKKNMCNQQGLNGRPQPGANGKASLGVDGEEQRVKESKTAAGDVTGSSFGQRQQQFQNVAQQHQRQQQQQVLLDSQPSVDCKLHAAHTAGGKLGLWRLCSGLMNDVATAVQVHSSSKRAKQVAASGWFDYIPADSFADELHCYIPDVSWLTHPLVSPTYLEDFSSLCQRGMLVLAGGAELMRPDIQAFADKAAAAVAAAAAAEVDAQGRQGFKVVYHEEPGEPHAFAMLTLPHLLRKGLVVPDFVADMALRSS